MHFHHPPLRGDICRQILVFSPCICVANKLTVYAFTKCQPGNGQATKLTPELLRIELLRIVEEQMERDNEMTAMQLAVGMVSC